MILNVYIIVENDYVIHMFGLCVEELVVILHSSDSLSHYLSYVIYYW